MAGAADGKSEAPAPEPGNTGLRKFTPGRFFTIVKAVSWVELALFAGLLFFWLGPVHSDQWTFIFGLSHGIGFLVLCLVVWIAVMRREAPYYLLAATVTPVGPVGAVIAIEYIERHRPDRPAA